MPKIKKIVLIISALLSFGFFGALPALAASGATNTNACKDVPNNPKISCADCHPDHSGAPSLCNCHPEYYFGAALTDQQLASCETCNQAGLKYEVAKHPTQDEINAGNSALQSCLQKNPITTDINIFVNVLSAVATIVIIGSLIAGGIQYSMAGNPQAATNARKRIMNGLLALAGLFFLWAFLQWLIPGGI